MTELGHIWAKWAMRFLVVRKVAAEAIVNAAAIGTTSSM